MHAYIAQVQFICQLTQSCTPTGKIRCLLENIFSHLWKSWIRTGKKYHFVYRIVGPVSICIALWENVSLQPYQVLPNFFSVKKPLWWHFQPVTILLVFFYKVGANELLVFNFKWNLTLQNFTNWGLKVLNNLFLKILGSKWFNPFTPEPPETAWADPRPFYHLWCHQF